MLQERYSRQVLFAPIGEEGQKRIRNSRVLVLGVGGLGSVSADMLARAGVGFLRLLDRDYVELSNLQRQSLYDEECLRRNLPKAVAAAEKIGQINHQVAVDARVEDLNPGNVEGFIADVELVVDGTDNFETRYVLNDACVRLGRTWIYGACVGSYGLSFVIRPGKTPCLRCWMEQEPPLASSPTCDTAGVIAPVVHAVASFQVTEALKILAGREEMLNGSMVAIDVWRGTVDQFRHSEPRKDCPACGRHEFEYLSGRLTSQTTSLCGRNAVQVRPGQPGVIQLEELARRLGPLGRVDVNPYLLRFRLGERELVVFPDGRAIVHGTDDPVEAASLYARYVGH